MADFHPQAEEFRADGGSCRPYLRPRLLDALMDGRPRASDSPLLRLPAELLADIVDLLAVDPASLSSLALVNSDCRQLARSSQFAHVKLGRDPKSCRLASHLIREDEAASQSRYASGQSTSTVAPPASACPPLGRCVRRLVVANGFHPDLYTPTTSLDRKVTTGLPCTLDASFRPLALSIIRSVPHLEALLWCDRRPLDLDFFRFLADTSIRHLLLDATIADGHLITQSALPPNSLALRTLLLQLSSPPRSPRASPAHDTPPHSSQFFNSLIQSCASTLQSLTWYNNNLVNEEVFSFDPTVTPPLSFPSLRHLSLNRLRLSPSALDTFLRLPRLTHLHLPDPALNPGVAPCLASCEPIPALDTLIIPVLPDPDTANAFLNFATRHPRISSLSVGFRPDAKVDSMVIQRIRDAGFSNLRSLSLSWMTDPSGSPYSHVLQNPTASLDAISTLDTLERLYLSLAAGDQSTPRWCVDHDALRTSLRPLSRLKRLSLSLDTYPSPFSSTGRDYYIHRVTTDQDLLNATTRPELDGDECLGSESEDDEEEEGEDGKGGEEGREVDGPKTDGYDSPQNATTTDEDDPGEEPQGGAAPPMPDAFLKMNITFSEVWERSHRNHMLTQAELYAVTLPKLESIYCGQWSMSIQPPNRKGTRKAVPLSSERSPQPDPSILDTNRIF